MKNINAIKESKKEKITSSNEEQSSKLNNSSIIQYNSKVNVNIVKNNFKKKQLKSFTTHNTAMIPLFQFLLNCLCYNYDPNRVPMYLDLLLSDNEIYDQKNLFLKSAQIPISSSIKSYSSDNGLPYAVYSFIINGQFMSSINNKKVVGVVLYNNANLKSISSYQDNSINLTDSNISNLFSMVVLFDKGQVLESDSTMFIDWMIRLQDGGEITN